jgi:hypothetical protein
MLGEHDRRPEPFDRPEEELRGVGIELRGRLVEEEQRGLEGEGRGETHPLELSPRELDRLPAPEVKRVHRRERALHARPDLRGRNAEVLQPEGDLVGDDAHHDLVLRVLEDGGDRPRELGGARPPRVGAPHGHPAGEAAAVEVRHETRKRAKQR